MSLYIFDLDGVIYRGEKLLPGAKETLNLLRRRGEEICFLSNNSTLSRWGYLRKLTRLEIQVSLEELFPSSYLAAVYFKTLESVFDDSFGMQENSSEYFQVRDRKKGDQGRRKERLFIIGEEGLFEELSKAGLNIVQEVSEADYVVVGMDRKFNFKKLCQAYDAISNGAKFIATNTDLTYPLENKTIPAAGAIVKAIEVSTGKPPLVLGKPEVFGLETVMKARKYSPENTIIIGDRLETDILAGRRMKITTVLVLSGISSQKEMEKLPPSRRPDYVISSLQDLPSLAP